jgi:oligopeptide/dipeptide ABC transporter ATP-binding protein
VISTPSAISAGVGLSVCDLTVGFRKQSGLVNAVHSISLDIDRAGTLGLVGESGSGKSVTAMALVKLLDRRTATITGSVMLDGVDLLALSDSGLRRVRGAEVGFVFQDPLGSLNPGMRIGRQLLEPLRLHGLGRGDKARARALEMLDLVGINDPKRRFRQYPHELSGGMRQRVAIAAALIARPKLLILDEPTTALDVTIQAQILALLRDLRRELDMTMLLISHDLGVVAQVADRVSVMYAGRIVETGSTQAVLDTPRHPYTRGLMASRPELGHGSREPLRPIAGQPPSLEAHAVAACSFQPRCPVAVERCSRELPQLIGREHCVACWVASGLEEAGRRG